MLGTLLGHIKLSVQFPNMAPSTTYTHRVAMSCIVICISSLERKPQLSQEGPCFVHTCAYHGV